MKLIISVLVLLSFTSFGDARSRFLAIPLNDVQVVDLTDTDNVDRLPLIRLPRSAGHKPQKFGSYYQSQPQAEASSHFEQANFSPQEYVDYGAHTGHHGSFGWYADFPVHKD